MPQWKPEYNTRYPRPLHLRPDRADQKIIDQIRADLTSQARPASDSDVLRAALRAYILPLASKTTPTPRQ